MPGEETEVRPVSNPRGCQMAKWTQMTKHCTWLRCQGLKRSPHVLTPATEEWKPENNPGTYGCLTVISYWLQLCTLWQKKQASWKDTQSSQMMNHPHQKNRWTVNICLQKETLHWTTKGTKVAHCHPPPGGGSQGKSTNGKMLSIKERRSTMIKLCSSNPVDTHKLGKSSARMNDIRSHHNIYQHCALVTDPSQVVSKKKLCKRVTGPDGSCYTLNQHYMRHVKNTKIPAATQNWKKVTKNEEAWEHNRAVAQQDSNGVWS